jgi:F-type H+-transporting ATPase subunit a
MEHLAEELMAELEVETAFTIPVFGGIEVAESVVITWVVMAALFVMSLLLTRNLKVKDCSKRQIVAEFLVTKLQDMFKNIIGEEGKQYVPYLVTVILYLGLSNIIGVFGIKPPTKDLNVTVALAVMSIVLIEIAGIRAKGPKKWAKSFTEPVALVTPFNILEIIIKPLSLCMRLFGNILGAFVIMELIKLVIPVGVPVIFCFYFDFFDGLLQAYVFVFLTSLYIREAVETHS